MILKIYIRAKAITWLNFNCLFIYKTECNLKVKVFERNIYGGKKKITKLQQYYEEILSKTKWWKTLKVWWNKTSVRKILDKSKYTQHVETRRKLIIEPYRIHHNKKEVSRVYNIYYLGIFVKRFYSHFISWLKNLILITLFNRYSSAL